MPVMVLDVPSSAWNETVLQSVLYGLDMCPDTHRSEGSTVVEITGSWEKLNQVLNKVKRRTFVAPQLLGVMENKQIDQCR